MFEQVNKAYEFLCSKNAKNKANGPDPKNIVLVLQAQSILFKRYKDGKSLLVLAILDNFWSFFFIIGDEITLPLTPLGVEEVFCCMLWLSLQQFMFYRIIWSCDTWLLISILLIIILFLESIVRTDVGSFFSKFG